MTGAWPYGVSRAVRRKKQWDFGGASVSSQHQTHISGLYLPCEVGDQGWVAGLGCRLLQWLRLPKEGVLAALSALGG